MSASCLEKSRTVLVEVLSRSLSRLPSSSCCSTSVWHETSDKLILDLIVPGGLLSEDTRHVDATEFIHRHIIYCSNICEHHCRHWRQKVARGHRRIFEIGMIIFRVLVVVVVVVVGNPCK